MPVENTNSTPEEKSPIESRLLRYLEDTIKWYTKKKDSAGITTSRDYFEGRIDAYEEIIKIFQLK